MIGRRFGLALAVGAVFVGACVRETPESRAPEDVCAPGRPALRGLEYSTSPSPLVAEKSRRSELPVPYPRSDSSRSFVRIGAERLEFEMDAEAPSVAPAEWDWCVRGDMPKSDIPAAYLESYTRRATVRRVWFEEGEVAATVFSVSFPRRFHAEQRNLERTLVGSTLVLQDAQGRRSGFGWRGRGGIVRLSSGVFVVQPPRREHVERVTTHPYFASGGRRRAKIQGPFTVGPDGVPRRFRTRLREMAGWGDNRVWGLSRNHGTLIATDRHGRVFFRHRLRGRGRGVVPFREGACVVMEPAGVNCFNLDGKQTVELDLADATTFVVDPDGRIYAGTPSKVYAFAPDGSKRWEDSVPGRSGDLAVLPASGLCTARGGTSLSVVCYGVDSGSGNSADPSL